MSCLAPEKMGSGLCIINPSTELLLIGVSTKFVLSPLCQASFYALLLRSFLRRFLRRSPSTTHRHASHRHSLRRAHSCLTKFAQSPSSRNYGRLARGLGR